MNRRMCTPTRDKHIFRLIHNNLFLSEWNALISPTGKGFTAASFPKVDGSALGTY